MVGNLNISTWSPARYLTEQPVQPLHGHPGVGSERVEHVADVLPIEVSTKFRNLQLQFTISLFKAFSESEYCEFREISLTVLFPGLIGDSPVVAGGEERAAVLEEAGERPAHVGARRPRPAPAQPAAQWPRGRPATGIVISGSGQWI